jgi:hypothetical protein
MSIIIPIKTETNFMSRDYAKEDSELDAELAAMYAKGEESQQKEPEAESPAEAGTESEQTEEPEQQAAEEPTEEEGTLNDADPIKEEQAEATVPESRYKEAVKAMNVAQATLADLRKQDVARDSLLRDLQDQVKQLQEVKVEKAKEEEATPADAEDDLAEAKELYPEVIGPLLKRINDLQKKLSKVDDSVTTVKTVADRYQKNEAKSAEDKHWEHIKNAHPDLNDVVNSPEYADWFPQQAPMIQDALKQGTARDVVAALNLYRSEHPKSVDVPVEAVKEAPAVVKPVSKLAEAKKASSPVVKSSTKPEEKQAYTQAQIAKMSREEFTKNEAAIDEAMARGEIK